MGVFEKILSFNFFKKHPKLFCSQLGNQISLRGRFVFKTNGRIFSITSYKNNCCSFFTSLVIKPSKKLYFGNFEKTPNFGRMVRTLDYSSNLKLLFSEAYTQRSIGICEKNEEEGNFWLILKFFFLNTPSKSSRN